MEQLFLKLHGLYQRLEEKLLHIPGVLGASLSGYSPLSGNNWNERVYIEGKPPDYRWTAPSWNRVGPDYFETIGTRLLQGRAIDERSEEHTSELQSHSDLVCRLLLE